MDTSRCCLLAQACKLLNAVCASGDLCALERTDSTARAHAVTHSREHVLGENQQDLVLLFVRVGGAAAH